MNQRQKIWRPVHFDTRWKDVQTVRFDNIRPSWDKKRLDLIKNPEQYARFIEQLKRKQAVDTGIIERLYDLKRGVTETLIKEGFAESYLQHGDSNIEPELLMGYIKDNFEALDYVFDFIKSSRELTVFYIRGLHQLITRHQDTIEAVDSFGNRGETSLLKGEFKKLPNNPLRDGIVYEYCPPEQVDSEMDNLVKLFYHEADKAHVLIKAAFIHHAFVQIHPFQDGNGRIARLLASFVLIKDNLFPFSLDRDERTAYIDALEAADSEDYQQLVDIFADNQIKSIEQALNLETVKKTSYENVLNLLSEKIAPKADSVSRQQERIAENMNAVFDLIKKQSEYFEESLKSKLKTVDIAADASDGTNEHDYAFQIAQYAKEHRYYFNSSLPRRWIRIRMHFDRLRYYQLVLSLHHYGYDNSAFAIGAFIEKEAVIEEKTDAASQARHNEIYTSLGVPPLVFSSEKEISALREPIYQQIDTVITAALGYIAEELT